MDTNEAIINPIMGKKPPQLGKRCVMVANQPDLDYLHRLLKTGESKSQRILMSRLSYGYENISTELIGPFIGAPYAVILLESLIAWGICEIVFFGWCGAVSENARIGDVIIPDKSFIDDGTSKNYTTAQCSETFPSFSLQASIKSTLTKNKVKFHEGPVWSTDAVFRETKEKVAYFQKKNVLAVEMEAAALFSVGSFRNIDVGCILLVSDELSLLKWKPGFKNPVFKERRYQVCEIISNFWNDQ
ncbi:MAG: nucleoside phosphorylase [Desulfobacteraceae bacterium]|nr:nucleoside phosphorylase [Desulfobacteraceae bacterium]MBC2757750.1 nucleoside phosphorylase [Desulfobacteraceae bacterium]